MTNSSACEAPRRKLKLLKQCSSAYAGVGVTGFIRKPPAGTTCAAPHTRDKSTVVCRLHPWRCSSRAARPRYPTSHFRYVPGRLTTAAGRHDADGRGAHRATAARATAIEADEMAASR